MAKQLNYTHEITGKNYPQSYWTVCFYSLSKIGKQGTISLMGFSSKADSDASKVNSALAPYLSIGNKSFNINADAYNQYFIPAVLDAQGVDPVKQCYLFIDSVKDIPVMGNIIVPADPKIVDSVDTTVFGIVDKISFFDGSLDV